MAENQVDGDVEDICDVITAPCDKSNCSNESDEDSLAGFEDDLGENEQERDGDDSTCFTAAATSNGTRPSRRKRKSTDPSKRKRIRRILREDELKDVTISAQKEEKERLRRLELQRSLAAAASASSAFSSVKSSENTPSLSASNNSKPSSPVAVDVREIKVDQPHVIVIDSDDEGETVATPIDCSHRRMPSVSSDGDLIEIISSDSEIEIEESDNDDDAEDFERNDVDYNNSGTHVDDTVNQTDSHGRVLVNVNHPGDEEDIFLAPQIVKVIKPHQIGGIRFLYDNLVETLTRYNVSVGFGCILAHAMGLGKTLQVIGFVDVFLRFTPGRKVLCIVPINTIQNWLAEFNMWLPRKPDLVADSNGAFVESSDSNEVRYRDFEVFLLGDNLKSTLARAKVIGEWNQNGGVLLMGYELFRLLSTATPSMSSSKSLPSKKKKSLTCQDKSNGEPEVIDLDEEEKHMELLIGMQKALCRPGADLVICDEGHRIKNDQANTSQALKQIHTRRRVVLTGYPLQNNLQEYWCMVDFVRPNFLGTKQEFSNMFERPILNGQCSDSTPSDVRLMRFRAHVLHSLLEGFVQRRSQTVLKKCLPTKEEHIILVNLSPIQKELYNTLVQFLMDSVGHINPVKGFHTCTKIWNHPDIFYRSLDMKANGKGNESPLTILDDCNEEGLASQKAKGNGSGGSLSNTFPSCSLGNQHTEANTTYMSNTGFNSSSTDQSPNVRSPVTTKGVTQGVTQVVTQGVTQGVTLGSQILTQTTARTTTQLGSTTSTLQSHASFQCLIDRSMPVTMTTQQSGCSFEGRLLPVTDMDWAQKVLKDYQLGVIENGGKLVVLMEIIQESLKLGEKILVFSQSLSTLSVIEEFLGKQDVPFFPGRVFDPLRPTRWARNKSYYRLDGSTAAQEREKLINSFNSPDNTDILLFMLSTRAGCLGINLIGASRVVVFDASWNPCHDVQAVCRVYRYGQKKPVHIYRLISTGTMEKKIYDRQISKQGMADRVVDELNPEANFTKQEIMKLICEKEPVSSAPDFLTAADKFSDPVLIRLCRQCSQWLAKVPFKHDSLLVDRKELKLTKAEKREAKKGYEMEKRLAAQGARYCPGVIQPVLQRNHLPYSLKPWSAMRPIGSMQTPQSSAASYMPQCGLSSSLSVPVASLIRAGVNAVGQLPNRGMTPLKPASINTTSGLSDGKLPPSQRSSCASDNEVVMIDLDELPSPTRPAQEPFSNIQIQPQQRIDSLVQRARNAFPRVSPALIGYLLNHSRGQAETVYCNEPRDDCELAEVPGGGSRASADPQQSDSGREHQTPKSAVVKSPLVREQVHVVASPSPSALQETPPPLDERPENSSPHGEANTETSTEQTRPSGGGNG